MDNDAYMKKLRNQEKKKRATIARDIDGLPKGDYADYMRLLTKDR